MSKASRREKKAWHESCIPYHNNGYPFPLSYKKRGLKDYRKMRRDINRLTSKQKKEAKDTKSIWGKSNHRRKNKGKK